MQFKAVLAAALACLAPSAHAQTQQSGLWELATTMRSDDPKMEAAMAKLQKELAAMPPEQRKQMEAAMGGRGINVGSGVTKIKICLTKEEAARQPAERMNSATCSQKDMQRSGKTMTFKYECTQPPSSGEGEMTFVSDKAYSGKTVMRSSDPSKPRQLTMTMEGKWLASDCGDVKPAKPPAGK